MPNPSRILLVDLEATCWDTPLPSTGKYQRVEDMEVIEFGAVLATKEGVIKERFSQLVRPQMHSSLSKFCQSLTGIRQSQVNMASSYADAVAQLDSWYESLPSIDAWGSWGEYDRRQLEAEEARHRCAPAFMALPHINIKQEWCSSSGQSQKSSPQSALQFHGLNFQGRLHRALDDACNIARLLPYINWD
ncbi:exonuclease domain-containing protein [Aliidiomarina sp. Khilg15.8]